MLKFCLFFYIRFGSLGDFFYALSDGAPSFFFIEATHATSSVTFLSYVLSPLFQNSFFFSVIKQGSIFFSL